ncbi:conserved hypothetical protein [Xanthomonas citri pv. fuscans]|nr:conserved hypothetical protein [Xanthomonas citri pv. fuscans]SOO02483.1 conserved hypothetical protein [Xanthomonas citri pv. fuscans]SOO05911.1 conserved hypothetical protein [Xanthomonas citri pv. fuscans]SOO09647.1 conserved hypothetical protein [Xanthomonas citri pv. fuscans]SOO15186.1 conserved hypothetical protein [Xanthomonas citri pv. fuscans]
MRPGRIPAHVVLARRQLAAGARVERVASASPVPSLHMRQRKTQCDPRTAPLRYARVLRHGLNKEKLLKLT